ncbi:ABC transporter ATP-binding protein [Pseudactinotalea terrae]|uniref:ABC transporter ATP-binding protein n=1 Tax=Pseudactinotalea terrae TaxID=1743262 RepID=UPI001F4FD594|nr:ABC transporter ATP-binding protein [Pseudactinotalea terrae]
MRPLPEADPGTPPLTTPMAFLLWQARRQSGVLAAAVAFGILGAVCQAALPFVIGRAIDDGLEHGLTEPLLRWCLVLLGVLVVTLVANSVGHRLDVQNWLRASLNASQLVGHHVTRTGSAITKELPTGEVVATVASDALRLGEIYAHAARFLGGVVTYIVVGFVLMGSSVPLGVAVLAGLPVVAAVLGLLVKPLQAKQAKQREESGRLTTIGSDTVAGLRILRGIGGEEAFARRYAEQSQRVRHAGVAVARTQSTLDALQVLLPGLFLAGVVWFGAHLALAGEITTGQLVTFYGYATFLTQPLRAATQAVQNGTRAYVAARKMIGVLRTTSDVTDSGTTPAPAAGATLRHEPSGLELRPGQLVAVVSPDPDASAEIVTTMARFDTTAAEVTWDGVPLTEFPLAQVRERIVLSEPTPALFTGELATELDVRGHLSEEQLLEAIRVADARDVLDSLPAGLHGEITEKGRSLSGGQRQRVALARALLTDAEVLLLIEPTSAVDAHTEARIAANLREARAGRTTAIVSASPLVLDVVDDVAFLVDGVVATRGSHRDLLERAAAGDAAAEAYRRVVSRAAADDGDETQHALAGPEGGAR